MIDPILVQSWKYLKHLADRCGTEAFCQNDEELAKLLTEAADALHLISMRGNTDENGVPLKRKTP